MHKELRKEHEHAQDVKDVKGRHAQADVGTLRDDTVNALRHHDDKLNELHDGQTGLPPDGQRLSSSRVARVHANKVYVVERGK